LIGSPEAIENVGHVVRRDAHPRIGHFESDGLALRNGTEADAAAGGRIPDRVCAKVGEDPRETRTVNENARQRWRELARQRDSSLRRERAELIDGGANDIGGVARRHAKRELTCLHRCSFEQLRNEMKHLFGRAPRDVELLSCHPMGVVRGKQPVEHEIEHGVDGAERVAQVVGNTRDDQVTRLRFVSGSRHSHSGE
jgi:hypothetical protein